MARQSPLLALFVVLACMSLSAAYAQSRKDGRFATVTIGRAQLNKPIEPFKLYVDVATTGDERERSIRVIVLYDEPIKTIEDGLQAQLRRQVKPSQYKWKESGRWWLSGFLHNHDGTYHTNIGISEEELNRSTLALLVEDANQDGTRDDVTIEINLSSFDWTPSRTWIRQSVLAR